MKIFQRIVIAGMVSAILAIKLFAAEPLELIIQTDKTVYRVGDEINVKCQIKNNSKEVVFYEEDLSNLDGTSINILSVPASMFTLQNAYYVLAGKNQIVEIAPGGYREFSLQGNIRGTSSIEEDGRRIAKIVFDFGRLGYIYDTDLKDFKISYYYKSGNSSQEDPRVNWQGTLASNVVTFSVKE